ncbi:DUF4160 domain-containing protein [Romeria aff. gracilis LEGE 07310]|uniref:DUF4160 domain-containing protein n=1 Tax=Vasconcelosia minhoensis LEGE 07310 TaxID=915328 RepID=A0A8J7AEB1_9CYAN|nr:DUF4160 domain-containing protein [Romeria gracilis]MBE9075808.1 DUF4160 domain-containing protein [Romeria aff. gracilis LEGE 07310]
MPTVFNDNGFRGMVYPNDHDPVHVHAYKRGSQAKINAKTLELIAVMGEYSKKDLKKAKQLTAKYQAVIFEKWEELYG